MEENKTVLIDPAQSEARFFTEGPGYRMQGFHNSCFTEYMLRLDTGLPVIFGSLLWHCCAAGPGPSSISRLCALVEEENPLHTGYSWIYRDKIKKLLTASAIGEKDGESPAIIRSVMVEKDGGLYRFTGNDMEAFGDFLFENVMAQGTGRTVREENGRCLLDCGAQFWL